MSLSAIDSFSRELWATDIGLYCLGIGSIKNEKVLRSLAYKSQTGIYIDAGDSIDLSKHMQIIRNRSDLGRLDDVQIEVELFEGANLRDINSDDVQIHVEAPDTFRLTLSSLGALEHRRIPLLIHIPPMAGPSATRNARHTVSSEEHEAEKSSSFRLAELEHLMQTIPVPLTRCTAAYKHPYLSPECTVIQSIDPCIIRRGPVGSFHPIRTIELLHTRECAVRLILRAQIHQAQHDRSACLSILREAENMLHATCTELDLSLVSFEDLFTEISALRFRLSPKYELSMKRKQSYSPSTPGSTTTPGKLVSSSLSHDAQFVS